VQSEHMAEGQAADCHQAPELETLQVARPAKKARVKP